MRHLLDTIKMGIHAIHQNQHLGLAYISERCLHALYILLHIKSHLMMTHVLTQPKLKYLSKTHPKITFIYLGSYLALSLSRSSRLEILKHHYMITANSMNEDFMDKIIDGQIVIWEENIGQDRYAIALTYRDYDMEGDLSLVFNLNSNKIFTMSFVFTPGEPLKMPVEQVLFITRVQGVSKNFDLIKHATKNLNDISPRTMLLVAIEAIATALDIPGVAGICAKEQITVGCLESPENFYHDYDDFWQKHGGEKIDDMAFYLPIPLPHKPLSMIKANHRLRTKRKRQRKAEVMGQISETFVQKCLTKAVR